MVAAGDKLKTHKAFKARHKVLKQQREATYR